MWDAINETLRLLRDVDGICLVCGAHPGFRHSEGCPTWPVIPARSAFAMDCELIIPRQTEAPSEERDQCHEHHG